MAHARAVVAAGELPVPGDLEKAMARRRQADRDHPARGGCRARRRLDRRLQRQKDEPLYPLSHAVQRVEAALQAARALPWPFTLTARSENFLRGKPDLDDTIRRLQAFEKAGADVLMAPGLPT